MPSSALNLAERPASAADVKPRLSDIAAQIKAGDVIPYLGPGVLAGVATDVPTTTEALAMALHARAPVGSQLRGNMWGTAQFIEQRRHRKTLVAFMADIFKTPVDPQPLHTWLAGLKAPLIVDTWYDAALARGFAAAGRQDVVEVQGVTRALENRDVWTKYYAADGQETTAAAVDGVTTLIYKPHGSVAPAQNYLVADSDYVEVLTEIDIQTPIPDIVKARRTGKGFFFIGCRFDDQMLRTYARQIMKRSGGRNYAIVDFTPTRMEEKFFAEQGIEALYCDIGAAVAGLTAA